MHPFPTTPDHEGRTQLVTDPNDDLTAAGPGYLPAAAATTPQTLAVPRRRCVNCGEPVRDVEVRGELVLCHDVLSYVNCCVQAADEPTLIPASGGFRQ